MDSQCPLEITITHQIPNAKACFRWDVCVPAGSVERLVCPRKRNISYASQFDLLMRANALISSKQCNLDVWSRFICWPSQHPRVKSAFLFSLEEAGEFRLAQHSVIVMGSSTHFRESVISNSSFQRTGPKVGIRLPHAALFCNFMCLGYFSIDSAHKNSLKVLNCNFFTTNVQIQIYVNAWQNIESNFNRND